mmetsp:Transcript_45052/g.54593  ORF Transcript_45052/g.54593 Transcript_45052/m.54593 type:complete len:85 (-) Transcript_45052:381-635(-)
MPKEYTSECLEERACLMTSGASQQAVPTPWVMVREPESAARAEPQSPILATISELLVSLAAGPNKVVFRDWIFVGVVGAEGIVP